MSNTTEAPVTLWFSHVLRVNFEYALPFESEEDALAEAEKYATGPHKHTTMIEEWSDADQAWWNGVKMNLIAKFGKEYLDDQKARSFGLMFQPNY